MSENGSAAFRVLDGDDGNATPQHSLVAVNGSAAHPSKTTEPLLSPSRASTRPAIPILTGLRGVLAVWVMLHNYSNSGAPNIDTLDGYLLYSGSAAVSAFFVLSGMIMCYNYGDHAFSTRTCYLSFVGKRYARLLPCYYLSQLMCIGRGIQVTQSNSDVWIVLHWIASALAMNTWFPWPTSGSNGLFRNMFFLNATLWSLQTELAFYLLFPLLLRALRWLLEVRTISGLGKGEAAKVDRRAGELLALLLLFSALSLVPILLQCYGPGASQLAIANNNPDYECASDYLAILYAAPYARLSEFILGILLASLYLLGAEAQRAAPDGSGQSRLVRFVSSHSVLHHPYALLLWAVALTVLFLELPNPDFHVPGRYLAFVLNPGSSALGFVVLMLLMVNSMSPLKPTPTAFNPLGWLLTLPVAVRMGEISFSFYAFHGVPQFYLASIGLAFPPSAALAFVAALGLAVPAHCYVEVPFYQWATKRLPKCDCHDDHVGLTDIHSEAASQ